MKFNKYETNPTRSLRDLLLALIDNSRSLLKDAKILLEHKRYARAYSLTVLALDELLEFNYIYNIQYKDELWPQEKWRDFWNNVNHFLSNPENLDPVTLRHLDTLGDRESYFLEGFKSFGFKAGYCCDALIQPDLAFKNAKNRTEKLINFIELKTKIIVDRPNFSKEKLEQFEKYIKGSKRLLKDLTEESMSELEAIRKYYVEAYILYILREQRNADQQPRYEEQLKLAFKELLNFPEDDPE